jgi:hypothetical protein
VPGKRLLQGDEQASISMFRLDDFEARLVGLMLYCDDRRCIQGEYRRRDRPAVAASAIHQ